MTVHIILDMFGVRPDLISDVEKVKSLVEPIVKEAKLSVLGKKFHQFDPIGVSFVYLLAESHISFHSWPELEYVAMDIFTCGEEEQAFIAAELFEKLFQPKDIQKQILFRDYHRKLPEIHRIEDLVKRIKLKIKE